MGCLYSMIDPDFFIRRADWSSEQGLLMGIRERVFVQEQSVPIALERDDEDETATHWLAENTDQEPIGTARLLTNGHIGRMAVIKGWRNQGVGSALLGSILAYAGEQNIEELFLHAQCQAESFYSQRGFVAHGEVFEDAGIPHRMMTLKLTQSTTEH